MKTDPPAAEEFDLADYHGALSIAHRPPDLAAAVERLIDPASAEETLHWGRNYLYTVKLEGPAGELLVVVKQFRNQGPRARLERRLKGSKAARSWRGALALAAAGVPTPAPVMLIESRRPDGPSYFVSRRIEDFFEARYLFRALNADRRQELFPGVDVEGFFAELGESVRRLHEAGIWHRDLSIGNLLVRYEGPGEKRPTIYIVDLNRARVGARLTVGRRARDLSRLRILKRPHRELLLRSYWGSEPGRLSRQRLFYLFHFYAFRAKNSLKAGLRRPFRWLVGVLFSRRAYAHIPPAPGEASARDRMVWDRLSDQPHQHAGKWTRLGIRLRDAPEHVREMSAAAAALPRVRRRYRELKEGLYRRPVPFGGLGIALRPWRQDPEAQLAAVEDLGLKQVLLRLHPWEQDHSVEEELARELSGRGYELAFALPQNRDLVRDRQRWCSAVSELGERFRPYGRHFQVGQAVNRSKWGVWTYREYLEMAAAAAEILRVDEEVEILGPAVIDFELQATASILNLPAGSLRFDAVSSLLYVDRRGAPENRQLGFDTPDKAVLLRAIAETSRNGSPRSWITEVNWPLWEGPHAPAGRRVAVDEERQADYLVRYYLLTLGTGLVERVYWWRLIARGYGLVDPGESAELRRRAGFRALANLARQLSGSTFLGPLAAAGEARLYRFRRSDGEETVVGWSPDGRTQVELPRPAVEVLGRDGEPLASPSSIRVEVDPSPRYFRLG